jgi:hypothetical protein
MSSTSSAHDYPQVRLQRICTLILPVVVAVACLWMAKPKDVSTATIRTTTSPLGSEEQNSTSVKSAGQQVLTSLPESSPKLVTRPIEDIRPGMRVLASNPELKESLPDSTVTPDDWRLVSLKMTKEDGGELHVKLLRPLDWFLTEIVVLIGTSEDPQSLYKDPVLVTAEKHTTDYKLQQLLLGQAIHLNLPELGAQGLATVTAIDPCPPLDSPQAGRRLVTGTFRHAAANVIDVQVGNESVPFGCTDNHPFWSVDREQFVEAGQLRVGENLQSADGTLVQVTRITPRRGPPVDVFNFEVDVDHVYHVGTSGVLVHNACHHYWTRWLGSKVPYGHSSLTPMSPPQHSALHDALRTFLQNRFPHLMHSSTNSGQSIQAANRLRDRLDALEQFYTTYDNGSHLQGFQKEVLATILSGTFQ